MSAAAAVIGSHESTHAVRKYISDELIRSIFVLYLMEIYNLRPNPNKTGKNIEQSEEKRIYKTFHTLCTKRLNFSPQETEQLYQLYPQPYDRIYNLIKQCIPKEDQKNDHHVQQRYETLLRMLGSESSELTKMKLPIVWKSWNTLHQHPTLKGYMNYWNTEGKQHVDYYVQLHRENNQDSIVYVPRFMYRECGGGGRCFYNVVAYALQKDVRIIKQELADYLTPEHFKDYYDSDEHKYSPGIFSWENEVQGEITKEQIVQIYTDDKYNEQSMAGQFEINMMVEHCPSLKEMGVFVLKYDNEKSTLHIHHFGKEKRQSIFVLNLEHETHYVLLAFLTLDGKLVYLLDNDTHIPMIKTILGSSDITFYA